MKSKVAERISNNTPNEIKIQSKLYGDNLLTKPTMKQLRFTTTKPMGMLGIFNPIEDHKPLFVPENVGELIHDTVKGDISYIHNDAEELAGYDIPTFIDGNLGQLDLPIEEQNILMVLPSGEYHCKSEFSTDFGFGLRCAYLLTLK